MTTTSADSLARTFDCKTLAAKAEADRAAGDFRAFVAEVARS